MLKKSTKDKIINIYNERNNKIIDYFKRKTKFVCYTFK